MYLKEYNSLETGSLVSYQNKTYFIIPESKMLEYYQPVVTRYSLLPSAYVVYHRGYNIEDIDDQRRLMCLFDDVKLSKKQFTKKEKEVFLLKLKMTKNVYELSFQKVKLGNYYYLKDSGIASFRNIYPYLINTEELNLVELFGHNITVDDFVIRQLEDEWEVYPVERVKGCFYTWRKIVIKKDTNDKVLSAFLDVLSYPYYRRVDVSNILPERLQWVDLKLNRRMDMFDAEVLAHKLKHSLELVKYNKYTNKEEYYKYLQLNYSYNTSKDFTAFLCYRNKFLLKQKLELWRNGHLVDDFELKDANDEELAEKIKPVVKALKLLLTDIRVKDFGDYIIKSYSKPLEKFLDLPYFYVDKKLKTVVKKDNLNELFIHGKDYLLNLKNYYNMDLYNWRDNEYVMWRV